MSRILVAYASNSGSTAEIAKVVADELSLVGHSVTISPVGEVKTLDGYDAVVLGAPMIFGWHAAARSFLRRNRAELAGKKVALFACAMRLTSVPGATLPPIPLALDPNLATEPQQPGILSFNERLTTLGYYLQPMLKAAGRVNPVSTAFFYGSLDMRRLKWWQAVFVLLVVQATPGDYHDWEYINSWARDLVRWFDLDRFR